MENSLSKRESALHQAFEKIIPVKTFSNYILDIAKEIYNGDLNAENLNSILNKYKIKSIRNINEELLDLIIAYTNIALDDHILSKNERDNIALLKIYFKIREGDFIKKRYSEIKNISQRQFERQYTDDKIDHFESIHNVYLQEIFDLSYDQFDKFKEREITSALARGAKITDLDTAKYPTSASTEKKN